MPRQSCLSKSTPNLPLPAPVLYTPQPSFLQHVKEGFSFGAGAHIARHAVDRILGSPSNSTSLPPASSYPCTFIQQEFDQCIRIHVPDDLCQKELELLKKCFKPNPPSFTS